LNPKLFLKKYWILCIAMVWAAFQMGLSRYDSMNTWKAGGFGMYSDYFPGNHFVWFRIDDTCILARNTKLFHTSPKFERLVQICRTAPNTRNLQNLNDYFRSKENENFKVEVWRLNFDAQTLMLNSVLVNSYGD